MIPVLKKKPLKQISLMSSTGLSSSFFLELHPASESSETEITDVAHCSN